MRFCVKFMGMRYLLVLLIGCLSMAWGANSNKPVVAVFEFNAENLDSATGRSFTQRFQTEIQKTDKYQLVDRLQIDQVLTEQGLQQSGACDSEKCQVEMGRMIGADKLIHGTVSKVGSLFSVTINLVDVESGSILKSIARDEPGGIESLFAGGLQKMAMELTGATDSTPKPSYKTAYWVGGGILATAVAGFAVFFLATEPEKKVNYVDQILETQIDEVR